VSVFLCNLV